MSPAPLVQMQGKCTSCRKTYTLTPEQLAEAHEAGCAFSPCCKAVATIERVEVQTRPQRRGRV